MSAIDPVNRLHRSAEAGTLRLVQEEISLADWGEVRVGKTI